MPTTTPHRHHPLILMIGTTFCFLRCAQPVQTATATGIDVPRSPLSSSFRLQARSTDEAVHDKFFIPAIVTIAVLILFGIACCFMLGWCFNRERMERYYQRTAYPGPAYSTPHTLEHNNLQPRPISALHEGYSDGSNTWSRRQSKVQRKPAPSTQGSSVPGSPRGEGGFPLGEYYNAQPHANHHNMMPVQSKGLHSMPGGPSPMMSVQHTNPSAQNANRGHWTQDGPRMSVLSSGDSLTQVGSGEARPHLYSPHEGNTLSYASSSAPSAAVPTQQPPLPGRVPTDTFYGGPSYNPGEQAYNGHWDSGKGGAAPYGNGMTASSTGPPVYRDDERPYPQDKSRHKKGWYR